MIIRRESGYSFRQKVPLPLRPVLGKGEIWIALDTNNKSVAKNRSCAIYQLTNNLFSGLKIVSNEISQNANGLQTAPFSV
ncbi:DUF6538 domain-containing protein [Neokomagataea thailandica]|uniref:DUF6538 domain-containing protein n=1 Tax=Neokomagataea TaxID=1223423 RepID=UPI00351CD181